MNFTKHTFYIYRRDYQEEFGNFSNEGVWLFTQLEPVWFLFNLASMSVRELCSFSSVCTYVCLYFYFSRS